MVALRFLVPLDGVRIPAGLPSYVPLRGTSDGTPFFIASWNLGWDGIFYRFAELRMARHFFYRFVELRMARHFFIASWNFGWHGIFLSLRGTSDGTASFFM